jgi:hypothetical protein
MLHTPLAKRGKRGAWERCASFPVLAATIPNRVQIIGTVRADNPSLGYVVAQTMDGRPIPFFEPMYWGNHTEYQPGAICSCSLAGLALELRRCICTRLDDQPEQVQSNAPSRVDDLAECYPAAGETMRCRVSVLGVDWQDLAGMPVCRMHVIRQPVRTVDQLPFVLFASECILQGCTPVTGVVLDVVVWMQGYLTSLPLIDEAPVDDPHYPGQEDAAERFARAWNNADLRGLAFALADEVRFESSVCGGPRCGKQAVLDYLGTTIDRFATNRWSAYAQLGALVEGEEDGRPCVLVGINDPNIFDGVILFEVAERRIKTIEVRCRSNAVVLKSGRFPQ